ncbi:histone H4 transcription factor [Tetranychus urticae]|uniref:C2H2-type domain-containing protein n=1 Tax=Tetranychus urticae TaxID=32264 RepID=T1K4A3_TETUR|nr:histone H4 transcription factor [Tetranychus urticae]
MGKQKKKRDNLEVNLVCEWSGCTDPQHHDVDSFVEHLKGHIDHVITAHETQNAGLICEWSGCSEESFSSPNELKVHISYHGFHTKLMSFGLLEMKSISESLGKDINCGIDGSTRTLLPPLPDMFVCVWKDCLEIFYEAEEFYRHVETHPFERNMKQLAITENSDGLDDGGFNSQSEPRPCSSSSGVKPIPEAVRCYWLDCSFISDSNSHIAQHLRSHTQEKIIACPNCGAMFSNKGKFRDHLLRQLDEYDVQVNDQAITLEINDQEIMVTIHPNAAAIGNSSAFKCEHCDRSFHSSSLLREHNRRHFHYHQCDICGQTADSPSALKHHKAYRHSEDRPFACQFCTIKCKTRSDLRRHLETHNKSNPFKCTLCKFECRCCHTLAKHMKRFHQSTMNEYLCHECDKKFTRGNNLTRHLVTIHGYTLKPGQSRFNYVRDNDGVYTLAQSEYTN